MSRTSSFPLLLAICVTAGLLTFCSCTDEPSGPQPPTKPDTTSHDFVWEVDTLFFTGTSMPVYFRANAFYGTSASNVYMAGYTTSSDEMCWHWDGQKWENIDMSRNVGGYVVDVDGVDSTFIVFLSFDPGHPTIKNASGIVALDNGVLTPLPLPLGTRHRKCLHVVSRNEIYMGGVDGIQRYDGTKWEWMLDSTDSISDTYGAEFTVWDMQKYGDGSFEFTSKRNKNPEPSIVYLGRIERKQTVVIDTFVDIPQTDPSQIRFGYQFHTTGNRVLSSSPGGVFERMNGAWTRIHSQRLGKVTGTLNNLFGYYLGFHHFNGISWMDIWPSVTQAYPGLVIQTGLDYEYYEGTIFIAFMNQNYSIVVRGTQKQPD